MTLAVALLTHLADVFHSDLTEDHAASLKAWDARAVKADLDEFLAAATVDGTYPHEWCDFPDMVKCDAGKFTAPAESVSRRT